MDVFGEICWTADDKEVYEEYKSRLGREVVEPWKYHFYKFVRVYGDNYDFFEQSQMVEAEKRVVTSAGWTELGGWSEVKESNDNSVGVKMRTHCYYFIKKDAPKKAWETEFLY